MSTSATVDVETLSRIPLFSTLQPDDLKSLADLWKSVSRDVGQVIFRKGEPSGAMYVVREGEVAITTWTEDNEEVTLTVLSDGDFFGELGMFDGSPRTASAKVVTKAHLLEMTREDFVSFLLRKPEVCLSLAGVIAQRLRATNELVERRTSRNVNEEIEQSLSFGQRISDKVAQFGGSWGFVGLFIGILLLWVALNTLEAFYHPIDPFPYAFLNLVLGAISALQAPFIMMSQNRQSEKDRLRAELDYQINLKAEMQIQSLHVKLDEIRAYEIHEMREVQRELMGFLKKQEELTNKLRVGKP